MSDDERLKQLLGETVLANVALEVKNAALLMFVGELCGKDADRPALEERFSRILFGIAHEQCASLADSNPRLASDLRSYFEEMEGPFLWAK